MLAVFSMELATFQAGKDGDGILRLHGCVIAEGAGCLRNSGECIYIYMGCPSRDP